MDSKYKYTYEKTADYCLNYEKLISMFKINSHILNEEERLKFIDIYCSNELKQLLDD